MSLYAARDKFRLQVARSLFTSTSRRGPLNRLRRLRDVDNKDFRTMKPDHSKTGPVVVPKNNPGPPYSVQAADPHLDRIQNRNFAARAGALGLLALAGAYFIRKSTMSHSEEEAEKIELNKPLSAELKNNDWLKKPAHDTKAVMDDVKQAAKNKMAGYTGGGVSGVVDADATRTGDLSSVSKIDKSQEKEYTPGFWQEWKSKKQQAKQTVNDLADKTADKVQGAGETLREKADDATAEAVSRAHAMRGRLAHDVDRVKDMGQEAKEEAERKWYEVSTRVEHDAENAKHKMDRAKENLKNKAEVGWENLKDTASDAERAAARQAELLRDKGEEKWYDVKRFFASKKDEAEDKMEDIKDQAAGKWDDMRDKIRETGETVADDTRELKEKAQGKWYDLTGKIKQKKDEAAEKGEELKDKTNATLREGQYKAESAMNRGKAEAENLKRDVKHGVNHAKANADSVVDNMKHKLEYAKDSMAAALPDSLQAVPDMSVVKDSVKEAFSSDPVHRLELRMNIVLKELEAARSKIREIKSHDELTVPQLHRLNRLREYKHELKDHASILQQEMQKLSSKQRAFDHRNEDDLRSAQSGTSR
eukprot:GILJ01011239.1.p1 GENE.GILJ01011239.1~~GILJ01011239.1.p1  ORF type:complete len:591 (-),score=119.58 GILJ01011239.1:202-1974(-)